jgi:DNA-binding PadR family transcriptional regulator
MNRSDGSRRVPSFRSERKRLLAVLEDLDGANATGPVIFRRMQERATGAEPQGGPEAGPNPGDQSLLYPALHSLEADGRAEATWQSDAEGIRHRTYRRRRLLPRRLVGTQRN